MSPLAIVLVHYHTGRLLAEAVRALSADLAVSGLRAELLVVDNGSDAAERTLMRELPVRIIDPGVNLGYAGGVNRGVEATAAEFLILMNPDVMVLPGCLRPLLTELEAGAAAAGPRFYWDRERTFLLPPTELQDRRMAMLKCLAQWSPRAARWARRRWRRHARSHWRARQTIASEALSGALLAVRRDAWRDAGPFDERFRLYFEETDWLKRVRRKGWRTVYVPRAEAVHVYNQSAPLEPMAKRWMAASARLFSRRHHGGLFSFLVRQSGTRRWTSVFSRLPPGRPQLDLRLKEPVSWPVAVEVGDETFGLPAASIFYSRPVPEPWSLPESIWSTLARGCYSVLVVDDSGRELQGHSFVRTSLAEEADVR